MKETARCPKCGRTSHSPAQGKDRYYCFECRMEFEAGDDGEISYGPPDRRLRREERRKERRVRR